MPLSDEDKIKIWERSIETQMHFAELSIKMRQIGLTLAGATIALAIVLYRTDTAFSINVPFISLEIPVGTILTLSAAVILYAAKMIDVDVYHRMLRGAVKFNELYEKTLDNDIGWRSGLTEAISAHSRVEDPVLLEQRNSDGIHWERRKEKGPAGGRIENFYWFCIGALVFAAVVLTFAEKIG